MGLLFSPNRLRLWERALHTAQQRKCILVTAEITGIQGIDRKPVLCGNAQVNGQINC